MTIQAESLPYSAGGLTMVGYLAQSPDASSSSPGVLVLPEWWGLNPYIRRRTEDLARLGYTALGVDLYGAGTTADDPDQAGALMNGVLEDMDTGTQRLRAAVAAVERTTGGRCLPSCRYRVLLRWGYGAASRENRNRTEGGRQLPWRP